MVDERLALSSLVCAQWVLLLSLLSPWKSTLKIQVFEPVFPTSRIPDVPLETTTHAFSLNEKYQELTKEAQSK